MTLEEGQFSSFNDVKPEEIAHAARLEEQQAIQKSCNQESWCCAWAPDCSYVAWSQGGGIVYLLPWNTHNTCLLEKPVERVNLDNEPSQSSFVITGLQDLPSLPLRSNDHVDQDQVFAHDTMASWDDTKMERKAFFIDCCDYVWSMAFGTGYSEKNIKLWRRFVFDHDLILGVGLQSGKIKLFSINTGNLLMELLDHSKAVQGMSFTTDGSLRLISCSLDCSIKFWDLNRDGNMYKTLRFEKEALMFNCKWSPTCKQVAVVGSIKSVCVWDGPDFKRYRKFSGHYHNVTDCDFSPDGAILITSSFDTTVILWDPYTGDMLAKLGHMFPTPGQIYAGGANEHYVRGISFNKDGQHVATAADDGYVRFWNLTKTNNPECIAPAEDPLCCQYSPNGHVVATGNREGSITFYLPKQEVASLQHMCRMVIRHRLTTQKVDHLNFPIRLKEYLKYRDIC